MSAICILAPAVIAGWPAISAAIGGAAVALGLHAGAEVQAAAREFERDLAPARRTIELEMENSEILEESVKGKREIVLQGEGMDVRVFRDERGQLRFCVSGTGKSKAELDAFGRKVLDKTTQVFIYNKLMTELKARKFEIVSTQVGADEAVRIHVRHGAA